MYKPVPDSYWVDAEAGKAHIIDSYGGPGPIVRKPLCVDAGYETLVEEETMIPDGVWVEGRGGQVETTGFEGVQPGESIPDDFCSACADRYFELLWKRPAGYPASQLPHPTSLSLTTSLVEGGACP